MKKLSTINYSFRSTEVTTGVFCSAEIPQFCQSQDSPHISQCIAATRQASLVLVQDHEWVAATALNKDRTTSGPPPDSLLELFGRSLHSLLGTRLLITFLQ